jgi:hypothetical protein
MQMKTRQLCCLSDLPLLTFEAWLSPLAKPVRRLFGPFSWVFYLDIATK